MIVQSTTLLCLSLEGVLAGLISGPAFVDVFDNPDAKLLGTIVAIYEIGCFFGACATFVIGDILGRKRSIILGYIPDMQMLFLL